MTAKTIWVCDGCDEERDISQLKQGDWHVVSVNSDGFRGYPTCAAEPSVAATYHLCPRCTTKLYEQINPRRWGRLVAEAA